MTEEYNVQLNSEELIGTIEYLTAYTRYRINCCRFIRVLLYFFKDALGFQSYIASVIRGWNTSMEHWWNYTGTPSQNIWRETCHHIALLAISLAWTGLRSKLAIHVEKRAMVLPRDLSRTTSIHTIILHSSTMTRRICRVTILLVRMVILSSTTVPVSLVQYYCCYWQLGGGS
jgi:hypothetical protein